MSPISPVSPQSRLAYPPTFETICNWVINDFRDNLETMRPRDKRDTDAGTPGVREKKKLEEGKRKCKGCNKALEGSQRAEKCAECLEKDEKKTVAKENANVLQ